MNEINIVLRDMSEIVKDTTRVIDKNKLSKYEFWSILLNPSDYGFKDEDNIVFPYDSNHNSITDIQLLIDILHEYPTNTYVQQDIRIASLLKTYGNFRLTDNFTKQKNIRNNPSDIDLLDLSFKDLVMKYSHPSRWIEASIEDPFIHDKEDNYIECYDEHPTPCRQILVVLNKRTILPYLRTDYQRNFLHLFKTYKHVMRDYVISNLTNNFHMDIFNDRIRCVFTTLDSLIDNYKNAGIAGLHLLSKDQFIETYLNDKGKQWITEYYESKQFKTKINE